MAKTKPIRTETYSTSLRCPLTTAEIADSAQRAAKLLNERDQKEEEMKAAQKSAKAQIEAIEADMRLHSERVRTGAEYRAVECERRFDHANQIVTERRLDTGAEINQRRMTPAERQLTIPLGDEPAAGGEE